MVCIQAIWEHIVFLNALMSHLYDLSSMSIVHGFLLEFQSYKLKYACKIIYQKNG